ncbi:MAG: flagellar basal-body MS-ring/collar protein FliF [Angelakisella sp.]|nr:flagellar basal-body MS-ring/collar protein FliF [Angelakisella sp.]
MKEQIKQTTDNVKQFWQDQPKKNKIIFGSVAGGVLLLALVVTAFLNLKNVGYKVLYPGISSKETAQVYATLQEMSAPAQINSSGEVMVPKESWDELILELAGKGYPKTAPAYGVFLNNTGLTTTEFEKKQLLLFQLQDRMQETLGQIDGIDSATVTIDLPQESGYVWDEQKGEASAGVLVNMTTGYTLSAERVSAIKNLVAYSVPKMKPEQVKVIDAATGVEMNDITQKESSSGYDFKRLDYERQVEKNIEDNIKRLLAPKYGADGVTAVAKVSLDYDKTVSESKEYVPNDNGAGVINHEDEKYAVDGSVPANNIVGEENNTDVPDYSNQAENGSGNLTDYEKNTDYDVSYILTQIEKGQAVIKESSVAVVVNDGNFTTERRDLLIDLISKGVNIPPNSISVTNLDFFDDIQSVPTMAEIMTSNKLIIIIIVAALAVLISIILIFISTRKRKNKEEEEDQDQQKDSLHDINNEIDIHKKMLQESAQVASITKENAITNEIRTFAKQNPEITAALIRSMLKEEK